MKRGVWHDIKECEVTIEMAIIQIFFLKKKNLNLIIQALEDERKKNGFLPAFYTYFTVFLSCDQYFKLPWSLEKFDYPSLQSM